MDKIVIKWLSIVGVMLILTGCQSVSKLIDTTANTIPPTETTIYIDGDDDQDGVLNSRDACPNILRDVVVDVKGCAVAPACFDCDVPNYSTSLYFNRNETYPTDDVLYEYSTGKEYVNNKGKMDRIIKNLANIKANNPEFFKEICIYLEGHSSKGKYGENNPKLSEQRVLTVKQIFIENYGIDKNFIKTVFYGSDRPIAPNNEKTYTHNQRVFMDLKRCGYVDNN